MIFLESILNFDLAIFEFFESTMRVAWLTPIMKIITMLGDDGIFFIALGLVMLIFKKTRKAGLVCLGSLLVMTLLNNELIKPIMERPRPYNLHILPQATEEALQYYVSKAIDAAKESGKTLTAEEIAAITAEVRADKAASFDWKGCFGLIDWSKYVPAEWGTRYVWPEIVHKMEAKSLSFPSGHTSSAFTFAMAFTMVCKKHASKLATIKVAIFTFVFAILMGVSRVFVGVHYPSDVIVASVMGIIYAVIGYFIFATLYDLVYKAVTKKKA